MIYLFKGLEDLRSGFRGAGRTVFGAKVFWFRGLVLWGFAFW